MSVPADVQRARGHLFLCDLFQRERMSAARDWKKKGRPAMAYDAVQSAREGTRKRRELVRRLVAS